MSKIAKLGLAATFLATTMGVAQANERDHDVSVTVSPIHLAFPMVELTGEFALSDKGSAAAIVGIGETQGVSVWEVGGQGRYYFLGNFSRGVGFGGEVLYVGASSGGYSASGAAVGPFVAGKYAFGFGLTGDLALGAQVVGIGGTSGVIPLININVGWSF